MDALHLAFAEEGGANTVRFLTQFTTGFGDYTKESCNFLGNDNIDETLSAIKEMKKHIPTRKSNLTGENSRLFFRLGHPTKCLMPKANRTYWEQKIARNVVGERLVT